MIFSNFDAYPDVLCITETKMNNSTDVDLMQLPGYKFIHNNSLSNAGGAGIYYSEKCKVIYRSDLDFNLGGEFEGIFIEIQPEKGAQKHLIIGSIYRHPHENQDDFYEVLIKTIEKINQAKYSLLLLGDLNINMMDATSKFVNAYKDILLSLGVRNIIDKPTRITETSETAIDHIITNLHPDFIEGGIVKENISDHFPLYAHVKYGVSKYTKQSFCRRVFSISKKEAFLDLLKQKLPDVNTLGHGDPELEFNNLVICVQSIAHEIFPLVKPSLKHEKEYRKPWMTRGILKAIVQKRKLIDIFKEKKTNEAKLNISRHQNRLTRVIEQAKANYKAKLVELASGDVKKTWAAVNTFLNKNSC